MDAPSHSNDESVQLSSGVVEKRENLSNKTIPLENENTSTNTTDTTSMFCEEALRSIETLSGRSSRSNSNSSRATGRVRSRSVRELVKPVTQNQSIDPATIQCKLTLKENIHNEYLSLINHHPKDFKDANISDHLRKLEVDACTILQEKRDWLKFR